jgi:hypothetical protein
MFDFVLVGILLALGHFEGFQHFFHLVEGRTQRLDDVVHIFNGLLEGGWGSWFRWRRGRVSDRPRLGFRLVRHRRRRFLIGRRGLVRCLDGFGHCFGRGDFLFPRQFSGGLSFR